VKKALFLKDTAHGEEMVESEKEGSEVGDVVGDTHVNSDMQAPMGIGKEEQKENDKGAGSEKGGNSQKFKRVPRDTSKHGQVGEVHLTEEKTRGREEEDLMDVDDSRRAAKAGKKELAGQNCFSLKAGSADWSCGDQ
jgi:hypothetical protein